MKYFTYEIISAANDWIEQSESEQKKAEEHFHEAGKKYFDELERIKHRVTKPAWEFFRHGYAEYGLHDARLSSFSIGDKLIDSAGKPASRSKKGTWAKILFLNQTGKFSYTFDLRGVKSCKLNIDVDERDIGDLYTYELTEFDGEYLQLGFIFASGAEINLVFHKLIFKRQTLPVKS